MAGGSSDFFAQHERASARFRGLAPGLDCGDKESFRELPTANVIVPKQQNSFDCGVFMLKYIDLIAQTAPDFGTDKRPRWDEHVDLCFPRVRDGI